jgi:hypothetical protein
MTNLTRLLTRTTPEHRTRRTGRAVVALTAAGAAVALAGPALAAPAWVITPTVDPSPANQLLAVGARTTSDAWAVGTFLGPNDDDGGVMLTEHWNGTAWSQVPTPNVFRFDERLLAVSPSAANDVWAVGLTKRIGFAHTDPLAAHYDGSSWTFVPTPAQPGGSRSALFGVANLGGNNAWAVGHSGDNKALVEHWDGTAWTRITVPDPKAPAGMTFAGATLNAVSARSATDIWASGTFQAGQGTNVNSFTLTMHWNGTAWSIVPSPNPATVSPVNGVRQTLTGVVAISANNAWAVGNTVDTVTGSFQADRPIALHWNGTAWSVTTLPAGKGFLTTVTASSANSVWAVGSVGATTTVVHWNGTAWAAETTPAVAGGQPVVMKGIGAVPGSATEVWAVGFTVADTGGNHSVALHHP